MNYFIIIIEIQCVHFTQGCLNTGSRLRSVSWSSKTELSSTSLALQDSTFFLEHCKPFILTLGKGSSKVLISKVMFVLFFFKKLYYLNSDWLELPREMNLYFKLMKVQTFTICLSFPCWNGIYIEQHYIVSSATIMLPFDITPVQLGSSLFVHQSHVWSQRKHRLVTYVIPVMSW